ncbi:3-oxoacyl-[acyl-carrier-protein] synthase-3 [Arthrobacter sp. PvP102]|jgi:3-oxoacyl-[acyl-carrier-protein] synthase-3|uniref:beta-ketoacyl-ACP synthase III n=1 Tax=unclassified Arthrobacter TaxID=235627 RepID=UPI0000527B02|nr:MULTISPECIES: beta-ketoacyl-ACP synthase III [unclassified Arthrobacter]ABK03846.1 3-oxoacyl-[acyl-carrier-protein] synthase III [Arthrobacter sp. FB24]MBP1231772.1 3-oxoacyl-[acyl-carrier-protein] synthase-3 [Arthrobacter sp. PvP103]MBP1236907.1 3-oxoacyl-[acyl-carrier-protein] synthase-3 [Arthrobacter sp. PvP102]
MSAPVLKQAPLREHTRILGLGAYRPNVIVTNEDVCQWIDSSDEWIRQRTGIVTRHRAPADVSVIDMAEGAAREALAKAGIEASQLGAVIVSTVTHPYATPSAAASLADRLGATPAPAFDISAACAGYCYGIAQGDALVRSGAAEYVLVVGAEKLSDVIDNTERTISFLLGDGAGAVVIGPSDTPGIGPSVWGSDGSKWDAIGMTHSLLDVRELALAANKSGALSAEEAEVTDAAIWPTLRQDGQTVFRWAVWEMAKVAQQALDAAGITAEDLVAFVPHQANMRIIDEMVKKLKLPESVKVARDIAEAGNTSAASIPLATHRLLQENPELSGGLALQIGFGAGLVFGAQVIVLP